MTLRMGDGPPENIPPGLDAVAGYVNKSGIGITYPQVVAKFPTLQHLSITTNYSPAMCADIEAGAMTSWRGYQVGYCSVSRVNILIAKYGRPEKLWTAHYDPAIGAHICSPECWPGLQTTADGTQWTDHGGWDESLLADDFFSFISPPVPPTPPPPPPPKDDEMLTSFVDGTQQHVFYVAPTGGTVTHWYYDSTQPNLGWRKETLP